LLVAAGNEQTDNRANENKPRPNTTVDSELAKMGSMQVREITNGCVCCVLVGQMRTALLEIKGTFLVFVRSFPFHFVAFG
jgi:hypothetical protein